MHILQGEKQLYAALTDFFMDTVESLRGNVFVALSGGSTPLGWFDHMATNKKAWKSWPEVHFFWGDERCVGPDHDESNYGMAKRYLFDRIDAIADGQIHRIMGEMPPSSAAQLYSGELQAIVPHTGGIPRFDMVFLGLGEDGHTASVFPGQLDLWNSTLSCVATAHPVTGQSRISLSGTVINNASDIVFVVQGARKAEIVRDIIHKSPGYLDYPASHVNPVDGNLHWFLDAEAAKKLRF